MPFAIEFTQVNGAAFWDGRSCLHERGEDTTFRLSGRVIKRGWPARLSKASLVGSIVGRSDLWSGFVDDVEGGFGGAAEAAETGVGDHVADALFSGLRAEAQANFLGARAGRTQ